MKKTRLSAMVLCLILLLSACGTAELAAAYDGFTQAACAAEMISFKADIRAEYDDTVCEYTLACEAEGAEIRVEILKPELLAGIRAHIGADSSSLEYDGAILDTGDLAGTGLTPVGALPALVCAVREGHLELLRREGEEIAAQITLTDDLTAELWLSEDMIPTHAEIQGAGRVLVFCDIIDWKFN